MLSRKQHSTIWNNRDAVMAYQHDRETKEATARGSFALRTLVFEDRGQSSIVRSPILCSRSSTPSPKKMNRTTDHPGTDANRKEQDGQDNQDKSHEAFSRGSLFSNFAPGIFMLPILSFGFSLHVIRLAVLVLVFFFASFVSSRFWQRCA